MKYTHEGAGYKKADLQLHSPRDRNWIGDRPGQKLVNPFKLDLEVARREWASNFIDACIERGVQVAALTDHHEGIYCWYVVDELIKKNSGLDEALDFWFIPGMELTCKDSAQALILFNSDITNILFEKARSLLRLPTECNTDNLKGIEVELLDFNIDEVQGVLEADSELRDKFRILPNVTPGGHKTVLRTGFHKRFKELPYVGGYLDKVYPHNLEKGDRNILEGQIPAWTSEKRGIVSTSDARSADFSLLGSYAIWVKLTKPTAESIRQAMLAADSRILYEEPQKPTLFIKSVSVDGAVFLSISKPISFTHQFTSIIGGRGSGKSTLLEFIRFVFGQSAIDVGDSNWDPTHDRRKNILNHSLDSQNGVVKVILEKDEATIELIRFQSARDRIIMRIQDIEQVISPSDVRKLFPIQVYSQGELSHLGDKNAETRLFELITEPQRESINQVEQSISDIASELRECLEESVKNWQFEKESRKLSAEILTLNAGIENIQSKLQSIPKKENDIIDSHNIEMQIHQWIEQTIELYQRSYDNVLKCLNDHSKLISERLGAGNASTNKIAQELFELLETQQNNNNLLIQKIATENEEYELRQTELIIKWNDSYSNNKRDYESAIAQLSQYRAELSHLERLKMERDKVQLNINQITRKISETSGGYNFLIQKSGSFIANQKN